MLLRSRFTGLGNALFVSLALSCALCVCLAVEDPSLFQNLESEFGSDLHTDSGEINAESILGDSSYDDDEDDITASEIDNEVI